MKNRFRALKNMVLFSAFLLPLNLMAQDEVGDLIIGSPADATKLINAYAAPAFKGFGLGLNSGWANSAKSIGAFRFDLRVTVTAAMSPKKDQSFDVSTLGLQTLKPTNPSKTISPTVTGDDVEGVEMISTTASSPQPFKLPKGMGFNYIPSPQVQLTVGLPKNIDVSLRYSPTIDLNENGKFSLFGIGAKVEVLPLILGKTGKLLPFDLAVAGGYTKLKYELPLDVNSGKYNDQVLKTEFGGFSAEAIISKKLAIFTPFASLGYNTAQHKINALGTYDMDTNGIKNPISIDDKSINAVKASAGFQLKLAVLKLYASYTLSEYNYVNAGIGLGIGK
ncbi:DUF6588 family protein [Pedobacter sp. UBA4863]|uniref:DUF6588 family protein n=1 Tax=Pedobacter sp. UBA4863 TaxID=1947060 RepID=UPI0025FBE320|nr:DUF6588 family protein [Pedobacter sp. UBA4863]